MDPKSNASQCAIYLFEAANAQVHGGASSFSSMGPASTPATADLATPVKNPRPFLSNRTNSKTNSGQFFVVPGEDVIRSFDARNVQPKGKKENGQGSVPGPSHAELENRVADLSAKIAELTALIVSQQGPPTED